MSPILTKTQPANSNDKIFGSVRFLPEKGWIFMAENGNAFPVSSQQDVQQAPKGLEFRAFALVSGGVVYSIYPLEGRWVAVVSRLSIVNERLSVLYQTTHLRVLSLEIQVPPLRVSQSLFLVSFKNRDMLWDVTEDGQSLVLKGAPLQKFLGGLVLRDPSLNEWVPGTNDKWAAMNSLVEFINKRIRDGAVYPFLVEVSEKNGYQRVVIVE